MTIFAAPMRSKPWVFITWTSASAAVYGDFERGYCQMIGGEGTIVRHLDPIFKALAPGRGLRRHAHPGATGEVSPGRERLLTLWS